MIKRLIVGGIAAMAISTCIFGKDAFSYLRTTYTSTRDAIKAEVPIEFELQRARDMIHNLVPDIRKCMHVIAEEEVNVAHLNREIALQEGELAKQKKEILALRNDVDSGKSQFAYAGRVYTSNEVKRDLSSRFERFKTAEATFASKKQILQARETSLQAAREKLDGMLASRRDLEVQIEHLDARVKTLQAAQTVSHVQLDDSQLSRAKKLIADLNKQLDVTQKMLDAEGNFTGVIPVEAAIPTVPDDLSKQIDDYFGPTTPVTSDEPKRVAQSK